MCSIAREYSIGVPTVSKWIKENHFIANVDDKLVTRKDFQKLKKKYARLQEENKILKAAAVILGNTHDNKNINDQRIAQASPLIHDPQCLKNSKKDLL